MTSDQLNLWTKINTFQLDMPDSEFSFSDRVARENGWTIHYAKRVIDEYKKFIFLCCVSDKGVTPSDPVDQVWHLHLAYTKSYWIHFCKETIGRELHHNPTQGGDNEARKFDQYYTRLRDLYKTYFEIEPPADIWQNNQERFSDIDFQRVNLKKYWLVKKPGRWLIQKLGIIAIIIIGLLSINAASSYIMIFLVMTFIVGLASFFGKKKGSGGDSSGNTGCGAGSCSSGGHHSGGSGCGSGCSGCSGSGCSGCGGGGGGD